MTSIIWVAYRLDPDGSARDLSTGSEVAFFTDDGQILGGASRVVIGRISPDGSVLARDGTRLGAVQSDGTVLDASGQQVGSVQPPHVHRQGALLLLL